MAKSKLNLILESESPTFPQVNFGDLIQVLVKLQFM